MIILRNIIAVILGLVIGSLVNMYIVGFSADQLGLDPKDPAYMTKLGAMLPTAPWNAFIYPFLAHAVGTFLGALVAGFIAVSHKLKCALVIGAFFLIGGIAASIMIPAPVWFIVTDIALAYIPMAFLGGIIAIKTARVTR